jgi:hypothetical protein
MHVERGQRDRAALGLSAFQPPRDPAWVSRVPRLHCHYAASLN